MQRRVYLPVAAVLAIVAPGLHGQDPKAEIRERLTSQFTLTQPTADKSDIAAAGSVLVLHKDGLLMYGISNLIPPQCTYKKGKITRNVWGKNFWRDYGNMIANQSPDIVSRSFAAGETFWVTKVDVKDDGVVFRLYSDPFDGVRYFGELKFPFSKGRVPSADDMLGTIEEVLTVQPAEDSSPAEATAENAPETATAEVAPLSPPENAFPAIAPPPPPGNAFAEIAPPPPPADATPPPKNIALGQTKDQVVARFGQPKKVTFEKGLNSLGAKDVYYYSDMKVTFVNGKVTDVQ